MYIYSMDLNAFVKEWLQAWTGSGAVDAADKLLAFYHSNVFYADPGAREGIKGKEQLAKYIAKLLAKNPHWVWEAEEIIPTAQGCTLKLKARIPMNGEVITEYGLDILELKDGLICRNEVFFDRVNWLTKMQRT